MNRPVSGYAWPSLGSKVDAFVKELMQAEKLPGMTVAVTKNGRLILTKGYGWANIETKQPMEPFMSSLIGSVTKAVVTGPVGWQLMRAKGMKPQQQKLYGPNGLFKNRFAADIAASPTPNKAWYYQITLQHLLDHKAGFKGGGSPKGAAEMFNMDEASLTYEHIHKHFLRTQKLTSKPGTEYDYSNHGFGVWTLIIEALSGTSYRNYVMGTYLRSLGLHNAVLPQRANPSKREAWGHGYQSGQPVPVEFKNSGLGMAAGGFRASAQDLTAIMTYLDHTYTDVELDNMAWGRDARGKLAHSGRIGRGGTAYAAMFPDGYRAMNGADLSRVHVAVVTNINMNNRENQSVVLRQLASQIALAVPEANVPATYDLTQFLRRSRDEGGEFKEVSLDGPVAALSNEAGNLQIIPYRVGATGGLSRGEVVVAGAASQVTMVRPHRGSNTSVTALRDADGNLKLVAWVISNSGQVTRRGEAVAGPVKEIAMTPLPGGKGVVTLTRGNQNDLKLVVWEVLPNLGLIRRGDIAGGAIRDMAVTTTLIDFVGVVSATTGSDRKLKLIAWEVDTATKTFTRRGDVEVGTIKGELNLVRADLPGQDMVVTAFCTDDADLMLVTWQVLANGQIQRKASAAAGFVSIVDLTVASGGKVIASVKDSDGNLRMIAYQVQSNGQIERVGTEIAGQVSRIASSVVRRSGQDFLLTAVRDGDNRLRTISWELG